MQCDFLVVGSGIAGLSFAIKAAELGTVVIVTKKQEVDCATNLAQGGVAAVLSPDDSYDLHIQDTLDAGDGLCDTRVVRTVVEEGPERIRELIALGVQFVTNEANSSELDLGKEGGHSRRRVAHAYDLTGREIERALLDTAKKHPNIRILENRNCIDLLMQEGDTNNGTEECCVGAYILDGENVEPYLAKVTVLCTGGIGKVYLYTSNPDIATGDGVAMAYRAGAKISNMEFVQFHPTCLYHHQAKNFLISEAVRGEGAYLLNHKGERFMVKYHPDQMELATRDKVARAIDQEMKETGADCIYLDISQKESDFVKKRFPAIYTKCLSLGIDITTSPIPVVPAAHYLCGGILTDVYGKTTIPGLFALGECSCTGLHGGNRLASNSLLEAVVYAHRAVKWCKDNPDTYKKKTIMPVDPWQSDKAVDLDEEILINHNWDVLRRTMWNYVGIVRKENRLRLADVRINEMLKEIKQHYLDYRISANMIELRNIAIIAHLIIQASLHRNHSIGLHYITEGRRALGEQQMWWNVFERDGNGRIPWGAHMTGTRKVITE